ncbi:acyltransferase [Lysobacter sp. K5869]|uniref:acyltransferase family protein n=1 Tax=Lysobacter sp. K5869 TaxID=2820808 RepID=UPI001C063FD2|nr:acyltransferase [Lysobacter sp. K5869]QWP76124.1 acyltransferase [Lysobacter sp. K5869]
MGLANASGAQLAAPAAKPVFSSIQMLRGIAALLIVLMHLASMEREAGAGHVLLPDFFRHAYGGVDLFFVISGFVMVTVARGRYRSPAEARRFLARRAWRIYPTYWVYTSVLVAAIALSRGVSGFPYDAAQIAQSYLLLPQQKGPMLAVGWTLVHELYFYLVGALAIAFVPERRVAWFLLGWGLLASAVYAVTPVDASPWLTVIASPLTWEFIAGAMIALYAQRLPRALAPWCAALGAAGLFASFLVARELTSVHAAGALRASLYGPVSALLVLGMAAWEGRPGGLRLPALPVALGDASYSLYLSHPLIIFALVRVWRHGLTPWMHDASVIACIVACIVFSLASYRWLEKPLLAFGERRLFPRRPPVRALQPA